MLSGFYGTSKPVEQVVASGFAFSSSIRRPMIVSQRLELRPEPQVQSDAEDEQGGKDGPGDDLALSGHLPGSHGGAVGEDQEQDARRQQGREEDDAVGRHTDALGVMASVIERLLYAPDVNDDGEQDADDAQKPGTHRRGYQRGDGDGWSRLWQRRRRVGRWAELASRENRQNSRTDHRQKQASLHDSLREPLAALLGCHQI